MNKEIKISKKVEEYKEEYKKQLENGELIWVGEEEILEVFYEFLAECELELPPEVFHDIFNSIWTIHNGNTTDKEYAKSIKEDIDAIVCFLSNTKGLYKRYEIEI